MVRLNSRSKPYEESKDYQAAWRIANPDKMRESRFKSSIIRQGISVERYWQIHEEQEGKCAACGTDEIPTNRTRFMIDHDHSCCPGKLSCGSCVRGLLCSNCNIGLGQFKDDIGKLKAAIHYLESYVEGEMT